MEVNVPPPSSQNPSSEPSYQPAGAQPLASPSPLPSDNHDVYHLISSYPFHTDNDYLLGLAAILGHPETPPTEAELHDNEDLVLQAQCFYFTRKHGLAEGIDVAAYKEWLALRANLHPPEHLNGLAETREERQQITSPVPRPHAPTPATAAAATTTLNDQPHQQLPSPPPQNTQDISTSSATAAATEPTPPYPTSFADIVDLITQNKPIPGIETIPDTVLEPGSSKFDRTTRRKKPWERDDVGDGTSADVDVDVDSHRRTGEGVLKILQPGAVPDSGLLAQE